MTNEEMQGQIDFIAKQQAQFAVNMRKLEELQTRTDAQLGELKVVRVSAADLLSRWTEAKGRIDAHLPQLFANIAEFQKRTDAALAESGERLKSLSILVERYLREGRRKSNQRD